MPYLKRLSGDPYGFLFVRMVADEFKQIHRLAETLKMGAATKINRVPSADLRPSRMDSLVSLCGAAFFIFMSFCLVVTDVLQQKSLGFRIGSDFGGSALLLLGAYIAIPHFRYLIGAPAYRLSPDGLTDWRRFPWQSKVFIPWENVADVQIQTDLPASMIMGHFLLKGSPTVIRNQNVRLLLKHPLAGSDQYPIDYVRLARTVFQTRDLLKEYMRRAGVQDWPEASRDRELKSLVRNLDGYIFVGLGIFITLLAAKPFFDGQPVKKPAVLFMVIFGGIWLIVGGIHKIRKPHGTKAIDEELGFKD